MRYFALLDANVLWPLILRDTLVRAQTIEIYRALWSREILDEFATSLKRRRPDLDPKRIDRTRAHLLDLFPRSLVENYESLIPAMHNDPDDHHVLAAAVKGRANVIVTFNVKHFPVSACRLYQIDVQTPDQFLCRLWENDSAKLVGMFMVQAGGLSRPPMTPVELIKALAADAPEFARKVFTSKLLDDTEQ